MRLINVRGHLQLEVPNGRVDVASASDGVFSSDPQAVYETWDEFREWAQAADFEANAQVIQQAAAPEDLECPVPKPAQVFAVGLNYTEHADESGFEHPRDPVVFTKFASSLAGPFAEVALPAGSVDWEVELVAVIGRGGRGISQSSAWDHIAGFSVGQDLSEREHQHSGPAPQFSLAKSHAGFSPIGPAVVTLDEFDDPTDLGIGCAINGEVVQDGRTSDLIFTLPELISSLSQTVELLPGDVIFTGTPAGVGAGRVPPRYLKIGDVLASWIEGIGRIEQWMVAAKAGSSSPDRRSGAASMDAPVRPGPSDGTSLDGESDGALATDIRERPLPAS